MIITGENLKALMNQYNIVPASSYDTFSISLSLDSKIYKFRETESYITYGQELTEDLFDIVEIPEGVVLKPGQAILACSSEVVNMPKGYIGLLQTKGSLARLFVTVHCCDSQIESGFSGKVTFEICNMGNIQVKLLPEHKVAQVFILQTSSSEEQYNGFYQNNNQPTISKRNYNKKDEN